ncbi:hypothetical protein AB4P94_12545 [Pseudomonas sp. B22129]
MTNRTPHYDLPPPLAIGLTEFINEFGDELLDSLNRSNPPVYTGHINETRQRVGEPHDGRQEFFILGRVRMRMGFHWRPVCWPRRSGGGHHWASCPDCGRLLEDQEGNRIALEAFNREERGRSCPQCHGPLWTLMRPGKAENGTRRATILKSMCRIPTIGPVRADKLLNDFGEDFLASMLIDNVSEFINLLDAKGNFVFNDRQAKRMERAMANIEFGFGEGGYQPTEFIKRYLPDGFFDLLVVDEGHEYKNSGSAQGQAMGVLAAKARKCVLLTGTLMGGYADDLFYLLFRILTRRMIEDGYRPNARGSMAPAAMSFMRDHGVLKDIYTERDNESHKTAKGKKLSVRTVKAPGFGPKGIHRFVLPFTVFLKLKDIGGNVLPAYQEEFIDVAMSAEQAAAYQQLAGKLTQELRQALARRDTTLLGVVLNVLLAWPDCCFRPEIVKHPRSKDTLAFVPSVFADEQRMPKEQALIDLCLAEKAKGRKVLAYTVYSGMRAVMQERSMAQGSLKVERRVDDRIPVPIPVEPLQIAEAPEPEAVSLLITHNPDQPVTCVTADPPIPIPPQEELATYKLLTQVQSLESERYSLDHAMLPASTGLSHELCWDGPGTWWEDLALPPSSMEDSAEHSMMLTLMIGLGGRKSWI